MSNEHEIIYRDKEIVVIGDYFSGSVGEWTNPAGEPGIADEPPEFYIIKITTLDGLDITDSFTAEDFSKISEIILDGYE